MPLGPTPTKGQENVLDRVNNLEAKYHKLAKEYATLARCASTRDLFFPNYATVPVLRREIVVDALPHLLTLRKAVMEDMHCGKDKNKVVSALGEGGIGKTTACGILANDREVRDKFIDGIYFLRLSASSSDEDVIKELAHIVDMSGGRKLGANIFALSSSGPYALQMAVDMTGYWFAGRKVLIVVDNVWGRVGCRFGESEWIPTLSQITAQQESLLLYATRDVRLAWFASTVVEFSRLEVFDETNDEYSMAKALFESYAGTSRQFGDVQQFRNQQEDREYNTVVDAVLALSSGWPIAIEAAGVYAKAWRLKRKTWEGFLNVLTRRLPFLTGDTGTKSLSRIWIASIKFAEDLAAEPDEDDNGLFDGLDVEKLRKQRGHQWLTSIIIELSNNGEKITAEQIKAVLGNSEDQVEPFAELCARLGLGRTKAVAGNGRAQSIELHLHSFLGGDTLRLRSEGA